MPSVSIYLLTSIAAAQDTPVAEVTAMVLGVHDVVPGVVLAGEVARSAIHGDEPESPQAAIRGCLESVLTASTWQPDASAAGPTALSHAADLLHAQASDAATIWTAVDQASDRTGLETAILSARERGFFNGRTADKAGAIQQLQGLWGVSAGCYLRVDSTALLSERARPVHLVRLLLSSAIDFDIPILLLSQSSGARCIPATADDAVSVLPARGVAELDCILVGEDVETFLTGDTHVHGPRPTRLSWGTQTAPLPKLQLDTSEVIRMEVLAAEILAQR